MIIEKSNSCCTWVSFWGNLCGMQGLGMILLPSLLPISGSVFTRFLPPLARQFRCQPKTWNDTWSKPLEDHLHDPIAQISLASTVSPIGGFRSSASRAGEKSGERMSWISHIFGRSQSSKFVDSCWMVFRLRKQSLQQALVLNWGNKRAIILLKMKMNMTKIKMMKEMKMEAINVLFFWVCFEDCVF